MSSINISETGLKAYQTALGVVADNLANAGTTGFKSESPIFETLLGETLGGSSVGGGVLASGVERDFSEGSIIQSNNPLAMAINGNGFFVYQLNGETVYSRNGDVSIDGAGNLVGPGGALLMGFPLNAAGLPAGALQPIVVPSALNAPSATTKTSFSGNLDASSPVIVSGTPIDPSNPATFSSSGSVRVFDSLGNSHIVTFYFQNNGSGQWSWLATFDGSAAGLGGNTGNFQFNSSGQIVSGATPPPFTAAPPGAGPLSIAFDFSQITQFAAQNSFSGNPDGHAAGTVTGIQTDANGVVSLKFSNGETVAIAQVALAEFSGQQSLQMAPGGFFQETTGSGPAAIGVPGAGGAGTISPSAIEESNVSTSDQLVNLVTFERFYEANAKALQTSNNTEAYLENLPLN